MKADILNHSSMDSALTDNQIVSRQRVIDKGEVLTGEREVNAMLDLVKHETERIESRFLEPACGTGNFLAPILERKLNIVEERYRKSQIEFERYAFMAVASLYGVDIQEDNVLACRQRLFTIFDERYTALYRAKVKQPCRDAVRYVLDRNIVWGDALSLKTEGKSPKPITFAQWSFVRPSIVRRTDYEYRELLASQSASDSNEGLFQRKALLSDKGKMVFLPIELRSYTPVHFLKIVDVHDQRS